MTAIGMALAAITAAGAAGTGFLLHRKSHHAPEQELRWFHVVPAPRALWGSATPTTFERDRLLAGLGLSAEDDRPRIVQAELTARHADLPGRTQASTLIGVPASVASSMPFAATGCGVLAVPAANPSHAQPATALPATITALPAPAWKLGLSSQGMPVAIHPVPGATIAIVGSAHSVDNLLHGLHWPEEISEILRFENNSRQAVEEWR